MRSRSLENFIIIIVTLGWAGCVGQQELAQHMESFDRALSVDGSVAQAAARTCAQDTGVVKGLSKQLVDALLCLNPGALGRFDGTSGFTLGENTFPYIVSEGVPKVRAAATRVALQVNSALRTLPGQFVLYNAYARGCTGAITAQPGSSRHESALAVDIENYDSARSTLESNGFQWFGGQDVVHFTFLQGPDLRGQSILAFQKLWNLNHPEDKLAENGTFDSATSDRLARSPAAGFPAPLCGAVYDPKKLVLTGLPSILRSGETADVTLEVVNEGTSGWVANEVCLERIPGLAAASNVASPLASNGWPTPQRAACISRGLAPGAKTQLVVRLQGPPVGGPTNVAERFALVRTGVSGYPVGGEVNVQLRVVPDPAHPLPASAPFFGPQPSQGKVPSSTGDASVVAGDNLTAEQFSAEAVDPSGLTGGCSGAGATPVASSVLLTLLLGYVGIVAVARRRRAHR